MTLLRTEIGDSLRAARQRQNRTLRDVSSGASVSLGYLSEIERGQKEASSELISAICEALDMPVSFLFREVSDRLAISEGVRIPDTVPAEMSRHFLSDEQAMAGQAWVRHTLYWTLMHEEFGRARAESLHSDLALSSLGSRTAAEAFEAGIEPREIWQAICDAAGVPPERRLGRDKPRSSPFWSVERCGHIDPRWELGLAVHGSASCGRVLFSDAPRVTESADTPQYFERLFPWPG